MTGPFRPGWRGTLNAILYPLMFSDSLDDGEVWRVADMCVSGHGIAGSPATFYEAITTAIGADPILDSTAVTHAHSDADLRDFLGRLRDRMDALRPWPRELFEKQQLDQWPDYASAPVIGTIPRWTTLTDMKVGRSFDDVDSPDGQRKVLVARLRSGEVLAFVSEVLNADQPESAEVVVRVLHGDPAAAIRQLRLWGRFEGRELTTPIDERRMDYGAAAMPESQWLEAISHIHYALSYYPPEDIDSATTASNLVGAILDRTVLTDGPEIYYAAIAQALEARSWRGRQAKGMDDGEGRFRAALGRLAYELDFSRPWLPARFVKRTIHEGGDLTAAPVIARIHRGPVAVAERLFHDFDTVTVHGVPTPVLVTQLRSGELLALVADTGSGPPAVTVRLVKGDPATAYRQFRVLAQFGDDDLTPEA